VLWGLVKARSRDLGRVQLVPAGAREELKRSAGVADVFSPENLCVAASFERAREEVSVVPPTTMVKVPVRVGAVELRSRRAVRREQGEASDCTGRESAVGRKKREDRGQICL
jgi:hypothetical protein